MDAVAKWGELLFGRPLRLRVLLWVWEQGEKEFHQSDAARGVEYSSTSEVGKELDRLCRLGMLVKYGRPNRLGPQYYRPDLSHLGWGIAAAAAVTVSGTSEEDDAGIGDGEPVRPMREARNARTS